MARNLFDLSLCRVHKTQIHTFFNLSLEFFYVGSVLWSCKHNHLNMNHVKYKRHFRIKYEKLWEAEEKYRAFINHHSARKILKVLEGGKTSQSGNKTETSAEMKNHGESNLVEAV